tara:strand:- start:552 stop:830 length:279 start_codon:yes stop_codon:yes gene_type:complete
MFITGSTMVPKEIPTLLIPPRPENKGTNHVWIRCTVGAIQLSGSNERGLLRIHASQLLTGPIPLAPGDEIWVYATRQNDVQWMLANPDVHPS